MNSCAEGFYCSGVEPTRNKCVPVLAAGADCPTLHFGSERQACVDGYTCDGTQATGLKCVPVKQIGESCSEPTQCAAGATCTSGKCVAGLTGPQG